MNISVKKMVITIGRAILRDSSNKSAVELAIKTSYPKIRINLEEEIIHLSDLNFSDTNLHSLLIGSWTETTSSFSNPSDPAFDHLRWHNAMLFDLSVLPLSHYNDNKVIAMRLLFRPKMLPSAMSFNVHAKTNSDGFYPESGNKYSRLSLQPYNVSYLDLVLPAKTKNGGGYTTMLLFTDEKALMKVKFVFEYRSRTPKIRNSDDVKESNFLGLGNLSYITKEGIKNAISKIARRNDDHKLNQALPYAREMFFFAVLMGLIWAIAYSIIGEYGYYFAVIIGFSLSMAYAIIGNPWIRNILNRMKYRIDDQ